MRKFKLAFTPPHFYRTTGFFCLGLSALVFGYLRAANPGLYFALTREDNLVEWLTVVWLLLAGLTLLATARRERSVRLRWVWLLGGAALLFGAGEEISWGQRILGLATPEFLLELNLAGELNVHNIVPVFDLTVLLINSGTYLLCIVTVAAWFRRKTSLGGIPLPSIWLVAGMLVMISHKSPGEYSDYPDFLVLEGKGLLLLLLVYALVAGHRRLFLVTAAGATVILATANINLVAPQEKTDGVRELREYLFGMGCLFYALEIWRARGGRRAAASAVFSGIKLPGRRSLYGLRAGAPALMVGSLGLALYAGIISAGMEAATLEAVAQARAAGALVGRSEFEVYLDEGRLIYAREPCRASEVEAIFFLHVIPVNEEDLPDERRQYGFDHLDFGFDEHGVMAGEQCIAIVPLPGYGIAGIRTGQYIPDGKQLWKVEYTVGGAEGGHSP